ncbi:NAD-dependent epimerase/dehydratase family protein [Enterovibrio sp. ZSDZ42]|uniref:NAD-dependent epimerase/dehydratase family protein n=1 Tax=Enterovibrio gelatinilyticus TaxID=2899819 RepID=A0ABT5QWI8_9GAMM|nr:NAD-dependent epimerase/dehydratase family protein [Enterovibrio sp. ZSDZ42]MDD1792377.1 NAD-dependent epimerase/dehydratase family protein [Enterovibrio sp. ZSDZ42]
MSILVTGATGFIGKHILDQHHVKRIVVRTHQPNIEHAEQYVVNDICQCPDDPELFEGCDTVIYLAGIAHEALSEVDDVRVNDVNNLAVISFAKRAAKYGIKRFIFLSSTIVHGMASTKDVVSELTPTNPKDTASNAKFLCEQSLLKLNDTQDIEIVIVRSPLVYGEGVKGNLKILMKLVQKAHFLPFGCANNSRHYISVESLTKALTNIATIEKLEENIYLVADDNSLSTKELINWMAKRQNKSIVQLPIPKALFKLIAKLSRKQKMYEQIFGDFVVSTARYKQLSQNK